MKNVLVILLGVIFLWSLFVVTTKSSRASLEEAKQTRELEPGVFEIPIKLSPSLEPRREEFRQDLLKAQRNVRAFAKKYGWTDLTNKPFMKQAEIFDSKDGFDQRIYSLCPNDKNTPIPKTFTGGIEQDVFISVTPEILNDVFPEGKEPDSYLKLIQHEISHRLHVRILNGDEKKMGPIWFYEGFAIYAADQYANSTPQLTDDEVWQIVDETKRGSYRKYRFVFTHFLRHTTLPEYVKLAGNPDFKEWLQKVDKEKVN